MAASSQSEDTASYSATVNAADAAEEPAVDGTSPRMPRTLTEFDLEAPAEEATTLRPSLAGAEIWRNAANRVVVTNRFKSQGQSMPELEFPQEMPELEFPQEVPELAFSQAAFRGHTEVHRLLLDNEGWVPDRPATGTPCVYLRNAPNTTDPVVMRDILQAVCTAEARAEIPVEKRLFPTGKLAPRAVYLFQLGLIGARWELRVRDGAEDAERRCRIAGLALPSKGLVLWRFDARGLIKAAKKLEPPALAMPDAGAAGRSSAGPPLTTEAEIVEELAKTGRHDLGDDRDFYVVRHDQVERQAQLHSAIRAVIEHAQSENAVLVYPDYRDVDAARMFSSIIDRVEFRGPIVSVAVDEQMVFDCPPPIPEPDGYGRVNGKFFAWTGATHCFTIDGDHGYTRSKFTFDHRRLTAALTLALSGRMPSALGRPEDHKKGGTLCAILSGGGRGSLHFVAEGVRQGVPYLVFRGSGRISDYLPATYLQRTSAAFDVHDAAKSVLEQSGTGGTKVDLSDGAAIEAILRGKLVIHELSNGRYPLIRLLQTCFAEKDIALIAALKTRASYISAARRMRTPDKVMLITSLLLGVGLTTLATVLTEYFRDKGSGKNMCVDDTDLVSVGPAVAASDGFREVTCNLAVYPEECNPLDYVLTVLPILLTVLLTMRVDLNYERHIKALDFAAARVDEESWLYRVRAGRYADSDMALSGSGLMDTTSERIKRLTQALVDISEQQLAEVPNWHGMATASGDGFGLEKDAMEDVGTDERGKVYMQRRVQAVAEMVAGVGKHAERKLIFIKGISYLVGATGSILGLLGFTAWVTVTTAIASAISAYNSVSPIEEELRRCRSASRALQTVVLQWEAVPIERRGQQPVLDRLVSRDFSSQGQEIGATCDP